MTRVGPAGWAYKDWNGIVYPERRSRDFHELTFIAQFFDTVEINTSFYGAVRAKTAAQWLHRVAQNVHFKFTAKLWKGFTHDHSGTAEDEREFKEGLSPLLEAGKIGALLLQFPWSFRNTEESRAYVSQLRARFSEYPLVLEVRHGSWSEPGVLDTLEQLNIGLCNIDQPLFRRSIKPSAVTTSPVGYIRLHGRNYKSWFTENKHVGERYDYLYSIEELDPWLDRIKAVEHSASDTYVITNNHYLGKAVVNAFEIKSILEFKPLPVPSTLLARYPDLAEFALPAPGQGTLSFPTE